MITDTDDILIELLLWLPAISLIRFQLVSKRWLSLISTPYFRSLHTTRHRLSKPEPELSLLLRLPQTPNHYYYLQIRSTLSKLVPYQFPSTLEDPKVRSFCNGLFLLYCPSDRRSCHVYNPTTRQSRKISFNTNEMYKIVTGLVIIFDPLKSPYCYKIVCVRFDERRASGLLCSSSKPRRCQIEVYESEKSAWKLCGDPFIPPSCTDFDRGIYWNNGVHWGGIFFDFEKNVVREQPRIVVPDGDRLSAFDVDYVAWNDCLYCVAHYRLLYKNMVAVFELQRDYSEWQLKHRIDLHPNFGPYFVLSMVDSALVIHRSGKIMTYGFALKSFKEVIDLKEETFYQENRVHFVSRFTSQFLCTLAPV